MPSAMPRLLRFSGQTHTNLTRGEMKVTGILGNRAVRIMNAEFSVATTHPLSHSGKGSPEEGFIVFKKGVGGGFAGSRAWWCHG